MTVGVEYNVKVVNIPDTDVQVELYMYDCAGQPIFNTQNSKGEFPNQKHVCFFVYFLSREHVCLSLHLLSRVCCFVLIEINF